MEQSGEYITTIAGSGTGAPEVGAARTGRREPQELIAGDLAVVKADRGFMIYLPDNSPFFLDGALVRLLESGSYFGEPMFYFRPEPWHFPAGVWPDRWWASAKYFKKVE